MTDKEREILERLKAHGVEAGRWDQREAREVQPQFSGNIRSLLEQLRGAVKGQIQSDTHKLEQLKEAAHRLKYGGGK